MQLPVHEQFYTFQGEGVHMGKAAYFIRLFGCPVHCPWCDSAGTWHPDYIPKKIARFSPKALVDSARATKAECVIITGGEPAIHDLSALTRQLNEANLPVHLETSGAFPIRGQFDWITLSPKRWKLPLAENVRIAHEFKLIIDTEDAISEYTEYLLKLDPNALNTTLRPVWLHPEWSQHSDSQRLDQITEWIKTHGAPYRAGWQIHKDYAADLKDPRSAAPAPLGGKPDLGY
jgi:organic radical activating enzyme